MERFRCRLGAAVATLAAAVLTSASPARADTVTDWNAIASTSIVSTAGQPPQAAGPSFAMVHGAVYDAVNAIDGGHEPYLAVPPANASASKEAAAATAAFRVLAALFPAQLPALQSHYEASLAAVPPGSAKDDGVVAGQAAAAAMLAARANDGRGGPFTFVFGTAPGEWRPAPPGFALDPAPWVANVRPFVVPDVEMLRSDGPNPLTSGAYTADFNEVKRLGSLTSTKRTADQTEAAIFWQEHGPVLWNRVTRALVESRQLDIADSARLFALENLAAADGAIGCWNDKYHWRFWRPVTAIREAAGDGNPSTEADPAWLPLFDPSTPQFGTPLATPGFPDHPAGHGCMSGAVVRALRNFFGTDKVPFSAFSSRTRTTRSYDRLSDALKEIIDARVWSGIHFRTADVQGAVLGKRVAHWLDKHYLQPTG
jgi:hypothetical protein